MLKKYGNWRELLITYWSLGVNAKKVALAGCGQVFSVVTTAGKVIEKIMSFNGFDILGKKVRASISVWLVVLVEPLILLLVGAGRDPVH